MFPKGNFICIWLNNTPFTLNNISEFIHRTVVCKSRNGEKEGKNKESHWL